MLAPEVWNFQPPSCAQQVEKGSFVDAKDCVDFCISTHHFNHGVSVIVPAKEKLSLDVTQTLGQNGYYKVENLAVVELVSSNFMNNFVKHGCVSAISVGTMIDCDTCVSLTPSGTLVINLEKVDYERLGLEGRPSFFCRMKPPSRYVVTIDLTKEYFKPTKNNYERVVKCLMHNLNLKMDFIVRWDPPAEDICPSSIGAYFDSLGCKVSLGDTSFNQRKFMDIHVPNDFIDCEPEEVFEWIGAVSMEAIMANWYDSSTEFLVGDETTSSPIQTLQWKGMFTTAQISYYIDILRNFLKSNDEVPWISLHVQGFEDSAVSWRLNENNFHQSAENSYTIILGQGEKFLLCKTLGANRKSKASSK